MTPFAESEIEVDGRTYRVGRLNAKQQLHVFRRLGPILAAVGKPVAQMMHAYGSLKAAEAQGGASLGDLLGPVMDELSKMPDSEVDYVIDTCLSVCARVEDGRSAPVMRQGTLVFQDMDMPTMVRLAIEVIKENIGNFLSTPR